VSPANISRLHDLEAGRALTADFTAQSSTLLATLGGIAGGIGIPRFEFLRMASDLGVKTVFIRDLSQSWYHGALPEVGDGLKGIARTLREIVAREGITRLVVVGNSMGGYGALIAGSLARADEVHAFSPITFIGPLARLRYGDWRWRRQILRAYRFTHGSPKFFDVVPHVSRPGGSTRFHVHYSSLDRLDVAHAARLHGIENVKLHRYDHGGHKLVTHLRDTGCLADILETALFARQPRVNDAHAAPSDIEC
jgi:pimeloyl-ACP methyl ester carboxylesterase